MFINIYVTTNTTTINWYLRTQSLEAELENCRTEIVSLEKQLNEILQNNLLELSKSSGYFYLHLPI